MPDADQPHYFTTPAAVGAPRMASLVLAGRAVTVATGPGVFSSDGLDAGTAVLLARAPAPAAGPLLDLGCGWGPIALSLAMLVPRAQVWAVDVNDQALALTSANAARLGLAGVRAVRPQAVPEDVRFAAIWSNPPIRIGKPALHDLLLTWLPRLLPGASAHLVVQRSLGADSLHGWLAEAGPWEVSRVGSSKGFRVLCVTRVPG